MRTDGRKNDELRPLSIHTDYLRYAEGSVLIELGNTKLICTASLDESVPKWLNGSNSGWINAEYGMLPRSTHTRMRREKNLSGGRAQEISRLIARSLRAAIDLKALGEVQIQVDCDVIQADGSTRTAAISGGFVALASAIQFGLDQGKIKRNPIISPIAAVSVGLRDKASLLDLNYDEDASIDTDMNFVMNEVGNFIEIQGTAEGEAFSESDLSQMLSLARKGCTTIIEHQKKVLA